MPFGVEKNRKRLRKCMKNIERVMNQTIFNSIEYYYSISKFENNFVKADDFLYLLASKFF